MRERAAEVRCQHCQGGDIERLWSRFATVKSEDVRLDALSDPSSMAGLDENAPKSMMRWMKRMGQEMGADLGDDFEAATDEEMAGGGAEAGAPTGAPPDDDTPSSSGGSDDL